jgi:hypothetical protein
VSAGWSVLKTFGAAGLQYRGRFFSGSRSPVDADADNVSGKFFGVWDRCPEICIVAGSATPAGSPDSESLLD